MTTKTTKTVATKAAPKATTTRRRASMTGSDTITVAVPEVIRFKSAVTKAEQSALESALESASSVAGRINATVTGLAVALTFALGAKWAEENLAGSLRSWAVAGAKAVEKAKIETTADPRFRDVLILAENRGADSIAALTPAKMATALRAIGEAETVKAKRAAIKANVPTVSPQGRKSTSGNAATVKAEQVAARITKMHEALPSKITGDAATLADLVTVAERFLAEVNRLADSADVIAEATK